VQDQQDVQKALDVARILIKGGVPVFAAPPCPQGCTTEGHGGGGEGKYHLPFRWEDSVPSEAVLDRWRPGWALAAVGGMRADGGGADFVDGDPRNGGDGSLREMHEQGIFPLTFGQQSTPSGGKHWVIAPTGLRKATGEKGGFLPGLDLQAGEPPKTNKGGENLGRGFVWIAPTVRRSKVTGELSAYSWDVEPDMEALAAAVEAGDPGNEGLITLIVDNRAKRNAPKEHRERPARDPDDPFWRKPSQLFGGGFGDERMFTLAEAQVYVTPCLMALQDAQKGEIEETANVAAATLYHFVPEFWSADEAFDLLHRSLKMTIYDPNGPSDWTAEKFRAVLDGRRPPADGWKASRKAEAAAEATIPARDEAEAKMTILERMEARLISAEEMADGPEPDPLVHGILDLDTTAWMIGAPGSLKSFIALDMAAHVAGGRPWHGHRVAQGKVLYIAAEGQRGMVLRVRAWQKKYGAMRDVTFLPYPVKAKHAEEWGALVAIAGSRKPSLIIIDTQSRTAVGWEENDNSQMSELIAQFDRLRQASGACVLVIHHTGRDGKNARGASAIDGAQDTELKIERYVGDRKEPLLRCAILQDKQKDMAQGAGPLLDLDLEVVDLGRSEKTDRALSSLVVSGLHTTDTFSDAQGFTVTDEDREEVARWLGQKPEKWTTLGGKLKNNDTTKRRILQVLADHGRMHGLTEAGVRKMVAARWENPGDGTWLDNWQELKDMSDLVVQTGGQRWSIDQAQLKVYKGEK
jgi:hypothetical protein